MPLFIPSAIITVKRDARFFRSFAPSAFPSLSVRHSSPRSKRTKPIRSNVAPLGTPLPHRIAVVGGGLAGLAVVYHLLHSTSRYARKRGFDHSKLKITLFDPEYPGTAGASAAAAGLLHQFRPRPKTKVWNHQKGLDAALHLLAVAETRGYKLVKTPGILKLAFDDQAIDDFRIAAHRYRNEVTLYEPDEIEHHFPSVKAKAYGLLLRKAHIVDTGMYMEALWKICRDSGRVSWQQQEITSVSELFHGEISINNNCDGDFFRGPFDNVVLCAGAAVKNFKDLDNVPVKACLGHNLVMESDQDMLEVPLLSGNYAVPLASHEIESHEHNNIQRCCENRIIVGATREYNIHKYQGLPNIEEIRSSLSSKLNQMMPSFMNNWKVSGTQTGIRSQPPRQKEGAIPIVCQVQGTPANRWCWVFTGLGGRGLIYHAFLGRRLAHAIVAGNEIQIPGEARKHCINFKEIG